MEKTNVKDIPNEEFFGDYIINKKIYSFKELEKEREILEKIIQSL